MVTRAPPTPVPLFDILARLDYDRCTYTLRRVVGPSVGESMLRVLIVEDEKPIRELLNDFLSDEGYSMLLAENGQRGVEIARAEQPDLVLMDLMLPLLDGFEAMRALKEHPATRDIPVIVMSANSMLLLHTGGQRLADATIRKPFDLDEVLHVVRSRIGVSPTGEYAEALRG